MRLRLTFGVLAFSLCAGAYLYAHRPLPSPGNPVILLVRDYYSRSPVPTRVLRGNVGALAAVSFSPNGKTLVSGDWDGNVLLWEYPSGRELRALRSAGGHVVDLAFAPDGKTLAIGSARGTVLLDTATWAVRPGEMQAPFGHIAFSPDGRRLAISGQGRTAHGPAPALYDVRTERRLVSLRGHTDSVPGVTFSPDGRLVATASYDHTVKIWDVKSGRLVRDIKDAKAFGYSVAFSHDGNSLAEGTTQDNIRIWDVSSGALAAQTDSVGQCWTLAFSPNGRQLAATGIGVTVFSVGAWNFPYRLLDQRDLAGVLPSGAETVSLAYAPDGKTPAFGNDAVELCAIPAHS